MPAVLTLCGPSRTGVSTVRRMIAGFGAPQHLARQKRPVALDARCPDCFRAPARSRPARSSTDSRARTSASRRGEFSSLAGDTRRFSKWKGFSSGPMKRGGLGVSMETSGDCARPATGRNQDCMRKRFEACSCCFDSNRRSKPPASVSAALCPRRTRMLAVSRQSYASALLFACGTSLVQKRAKLENRMSSPSTVLVTGGAGYIGSHTAKELCPRRLSRGGLRQPEPRPSLGRALGAVRRGRPARSRPPAPGPHRASHRRRAAFRRLRRGGRIHAGSPSSISTTTSRAA